jgi:beta-glucosidase
VTPGAESVSFEVKNTGQRAGDEVAEVYVTLPKSADEPFRKLAGFKRVSLAAGASETVTVPLEPRTLEIFSVEKNGWERLGGGYRIEVGGSSAELPLKTEVSLTAE